MGNGLTDFVDNIVGSGDNSSLSSVDDVQMVDDNTVGVVFDNPMGTRPELQTRAEDAGVELSDEERVSSGRRAVMARDEPFINDSMGETADGGKRIAPVDINREPDGEFAPPVSQTSPAVNTNARRGPDGQFVSDDLEPVEDIGRQDRTGLFDLFR